MGAHEDIGYGRPPSSGASRHWGESPASPVLRTPGGAKEDGGCAYCAACGQPAPKSCVFCPDCHFRLPPAYARAALRAKIACERASSAFARVEADKTYRSTLKSCLASLKGGQS